MKTRAEILNARHESKESYQEYLDLMVSDGLITRLEAHRMMKLMEATGKWTTMEDKAMTIKDILPELGISEEMIVTISGDINAPIDKGYVMHKIDVATGDIVQVIEVHPNVEWTDGTCHPTYGLGGWGAGQGANIYLNARI